MVTEKFWKVYVETVWFAQVVHGPVSVVPVNTLIWAEGAGLFAEIKVIPETAYISEG